MLSNLKSVIETGQTVVSGRGIARKTPERRVAL
jgi:hypothetical protein